MLKSGTNPPMGVKLSCMALTAPQEASVVTVANSAESKMPKRVSLPSMLPSAWTTPLRYKFGLPSASAFQQVTTPSEKNRRHRAPDGPAVPLVFDHAPEVVGQPGGDGEDG